MVRAPCLVVVRPPSPALGIDGQRMSSRRDGLNREGPAGDSPQAVRRGPTSRTRVTLTICAVVVLVAVVFGVKAAVFAHHRSSARPPITTPRGTGADNLLASEFAELQSGLDARIGLAVAAVDDGGAALMWGQWTSGPAWSTIKVPLAIAALREEVSPRATDAMVAAVTQSDNAAAESIWEGLGDPATAAHKVQAVLAENSDPTTVEDTKVRPEFSAFGQTNWSLLDQARFMAAAACDGRNTAVLALMGDVEQDQRWGLGIIPAARFKGGWGPSISGHYLVRQIGLVTTATGTSAIALAAEPASGSFDDGIQDLTTMARWLMGHIAVLPAGRCGAH
jgi:hypothetical protein